MADNEKLGGPEAIERFSANEERINKWVNGSEPYTTNSAPQVQVESIQGIMNRLNNDAGGIINQAQEHVRLAEEEADRAQSEADRARQLANDFDMDNVLKKNNPAEVRQVAGLPQTTGADKGKSLTVDDIGNFIATEASGESVVSATPIRNKITAARYDEKGYPQFLIPGYGLFEDMEYEAAANAGFNTKVTVSSVNSTAFHPTAPFQNQVIVRSSNGWNTAANATEGVLLLELDEPKIFSQMEIVWRNTTSGANVATPKVVKLYGIPDDVEEGAEDEDARHLIYEIDDNKRFGPQNTANVDQTYARRYWFVENDQAFSTYELVVAEPDGLAYTGDILALRFYSKPENMPAEAEKFDVVLYATDEQPFSASLAMGESDKKILLKKPVVLSGIFNEMCRNHLYIVPADVTQTIPVPPDYVDPTRAVYVEDMQAFIVADHRKLNYGTQRMLEQRTMMCWQCEEETERSMAAATLLGYNKHGRRMGYSATNVTIDTAETPRGAKSSYKFTAASSNIAPNVAPENQLKDPMGRWILGGQDFTFEVDLKYGGKTEAEADSITHIFNAGRSGNNSLLVRYFHRRKQISAWIKGQEAFVWPYAFDDGWHSLSLSSRAGKIFLHIDGQCIAPYDCFPDILMETTPFRMGSTGESWLGHMNNFRLVLGDCLHQSEDYFVPGAFQKSAIPDKTLWWDHRTGIVKEWQADSNTWQDAPMLPIGHIDTGWLEHVHTEAPRGTQKIYNLQNIIDESWYTNGQYNADYPARGIMNFTHGSEYEYITPSGAANNTADYYVQFELKEPTAFHELRLIGGRQAWNASPSIFLWEGSHNGSEWTTLVDRHQFVNDGSVNRNSKHYLGNVPNISSMKKIAYDNKTAYKFYRITFLAKGGILYYAGTYTSCLLQLPHLGAKPEITGCTSYIAGEDFTFGPNLLKSTSAAEYVFEIPFGGAEFDVAGQIREGSRPDGVARALGQGLLWVSGNTSHWRGEALYIDKDIVKVVFWGGTNSLFLNVGGADNIHGDLTLHCKRRY